MDTSGKWSLITIRFHISDLETFDYFVTHTFLPYAKENEYYHSGIEFPETSERHLHCVIKNTTVRDNEKVQKKIKTMIHTHKNKIYNTLTDNALDVKYLKTYKDISRSIGYICKQSATDIQTNIPQYEIDAGLVAYYQDAKIPFAVVDNIYEHKQVSKGNLLNYMYDANIKHPTIPIHLLEEFMIQHMKISFVNISTQQKTQVKKELVLITTSDKEYSQKYENDEKSLIYAQELTFPKNLDEMSKNDLAMLLRQEMSKRIKIEKFLKNNEIFYSEYMTDEIYSEELQLSLIPEN